MCGVASRHSPTGISPWVGDLSGEGPQQGARPRVVGETPKATCCLAGPAWAGVGRGPNTLVIGERSEAGRSAGLFQSATGHEAGRARQPAAPCRLEKLHLNTRSSPRRLRYIQDRLHHASTNRAGAFCPPGSGTIRRSWVAQLPSGRSPQAGQAGPGRGRCEGGGGQTRRSAPLRPPVRELSPHGEPSRR